MITPTIRTLIADDERLARDKLRILLDSEVGVEVVGECRDAKETVAALHDFKPDLLLLDIQMPDADGFQVLREIPDEEMPVVIFTTAYGQYGVQAFEARALDYLMKPFDQERLHKALDRVRTGLIKTHDHNLTNHLLELLSQTKPRPADRNLALKTRGRIVFLDPDEIDWIEAAANYVKVIAGKESYLLREGIGHVSNRLDPALFVRIHRSTIVNVRRIKELQPCENGEYIAVLRSGKELSCGRTYRAQLQELLERSL
ncbi:MAG TPA: LytTR family DNA-binding domain-containing protein [Terriglobales bacterium]|nr:LytTR family DNA-binding domain-containing protein [Terriglobales bacterium]